MYFPRLWGEFVFSAVATEIFASIIIGLKTIALRLGG
jgi:hypothetical protein